MAAQLLALGGDQQLEAVLARVQKQMQITVETVSNLSAALQLLSEHSWDFFLVTFEALGQGAIPLLRRLNRMYPLTDLLVLSERERIADVVIDQLIDEQLPLAEVAAQIVEALQRRQLLNEAGILGHSRNIKDAAKRIREVAATDISVLVTGPSGTGKELVARALHENSPRRDQEFVSINCASIPETLLESELFGHERGAFTGADARREGLFTQADRGTLLLDEIGEMHLNLQAKLLRALETKSFTPLGARRPVKVDVRVVAATNRDLQQAVQEGDFRADLYYRIGVITIAMQRLTERPEDILPIVARTLGRLKTDISFSPEATDLLLSYGWPGNVRELLNFLQRLLLSRPTGEIDRQTISDLLDRHGIRDHLLPVATGVSAEESGYRLIYQALLNLANEVMDMKRLLAEKLGEEEVMPSAQTTAGAGELEQMEEKLIREALDRFDGNRRQAAVHLGIGERTLYRKLKRYNIS